MFHSCCNHYEFEKVLVFQYQYHMRRTITQKEKEKLLKQLLKRNQAANLGYSAQGNEFAYHMILVSDYILNMTESVEEEVIYPYVTHYGDQLVARDRLRPVRFPDVCPGVELSRENRNPYLRFSMSAGEFVDLYKRQVREWYLIIY